MNDNLQVIQTDGDGDPFEISTTSNETIFETTTNEKKRNRCKIITIIIGLVLFIVPLINAFTFFYIPYNKYRENKKKFNDAKFEKISKDKIAQHFLLHISVSLYGFGLFFPSCVNNYYIIMFLSQYLIPLIIVVYLFECSYSDIDFQLDLHIDDLFKLINNNPPIDFIKVNYQNSFSFANNNFKTYAKSTFKSIVVPVLTNLTSKILTLDDFPDVFYIKINQEIKMSNQLSSFFINALNVSNDVGYFYSKIYLVSKQKKVSYLSKNTRIWSHLLGVGIYSEIFSKSIPTMSKKVCLDAEMIPDFNYSSII